MVFAHKPVLLEQCISALRIQPDGTYIDATMGGAGHSFEIASGLKSGRLICLDRDDSAIEAAKSRLAGFSCRIDFVHDDFRNIADICVRMEVTQLDGVLFDLGVSSPQLDTPERGFSYMSDAPLDMRMDTSAPVRAFEIVNDWPADKLKEILYTYGEERYAPLIAAAIERRRQEKPVQTTLELADIIRSAMPPRALREKQHPAKRSFQAIRIAVNDELDAIRQGVTGALDSLSPGGRIAVISFHSLEDRIVKQTFKEYATGCICPPEFPVCICGHKPRVKLITTKPIVPDQEELEENPRARSAKLRVAEKLEVI